MYDTDSHDQNVFAQTENSRTSSSSNMSNLERRVQSLLIRAREYTQAYEKAKYQKQVLSDEISELEIDVKVMKERRYPKSRIEGRVSS